MPRRSSPRPAPASTLGGKPGQGESEPRRPPCRSSIQGSGRRVQPPVEGSTREIQSCSTHALPLRQAFALDALSSKDPPSPLTSDVARQRVPRRGTPNALSRPPPRAPLPLGRAPGSRPRPPPSSAPGGARPPAGLPERSAPHAGPRAGRRRTRQRAAPEAAGRRRRDARARSARPGARGPIRGRRSTGHVPRAAAPARRRPPPRDQCSTSQKGVREELRVTQPVMRRRHPREAHLRRGGDEPDRLVDELGGAAGRRAPERRREMETDAHSPRMCFRDPMLQGGYRERGHRRVPAVPHSVCLRDESTSASRRRPSGRDDETRAEKVIE